MTRPQSLPETKQSDGPASSGYHALPYHASPVKLNLLAAAKHARQGPMGSFQQHLLEERRKALEWAEAAEVKVPTFFEIFSHLDPRTDVGTKRETANTDSGGAKAVTKDAAG